MHNSVLVADYSVRIKTGSMKNAATESNIYIQVFGDKGDTGVVELKQICDTKDKFSRGAITKINLQTVDVGNVSRRTVSVSLYAQEFLPTSSSRRILTPGFHLNAWNCAPS